MLSSIFFRKQISKLSETEFDEFFNQICTKLSKRELLSEALFHLCMYKPERGTYFAGVATSIIDARTDDDSDDPGTEPICMTHCPAVIKSSVSSFLSFAEVASFKQCDRQSYIDISSLPASITSIGNDQTYVSWIDQYKQNYGTSAKRELHQIDNLHQFSKVKNVVLTAETVFNYAKHLKGMFQDLNKLTLLNMDFSTHWTVMQVIHTFKFQHLVLDEFSLNNCFSVNPLLSFLCFYPCSEVTKLTLLYHRITRLPGDYGQLRSLKNLRCLALLGTAKAFNVNILKILGPQLISLHIKNCFSERMPDIECENLEELCLFYTSSDLFTAFKIACPKLKRIHFEGSVNILDFVDVNPKVEYIDVDFLHTQTIDDFVDKMMKVLKTSTYCKPAFKLRLNICHITDSRLDILELWQKIMKLLVYLNRFNSFSLIIAGYIRNCYVNSIVKLIQQKKQYKVTTSAMYATLKKTITITNINFNQNLCPFYENWQMNCNFCRQFH